MHATLRQLETLQTFAQTKSVTETARLTHVSQPAVSQVLKELELQFGFSIFARVGGRVTMTREAMQLLPYVERLLADFGALQMRSSELRDMRAGAISIMCGPSMAVELVPRAIADFRLEHPSVHFDLQLDTRGEVTRNVKEEHIDIGFGFLPANEPGIATQPLIRTQMVCATRRGSLPRGQRSVTAQEISGETLILVNQEGPLTPRIMQAFGPDRRRSSFINTNQSMAALNLVRQGAGVALLHPIAVNANILQGVDIAPFEPAIDVTVGFLYSRRRPMSRLTSKFIGHVFAGAERMAEMMLSYGIEMEVLG
jgi:DNA-binding transcriptional LysR family regulator